MFHTIVCCQLFPVRNSSCGKVMLSQAGVKNSVYKGGGVYTPLDTHTLPLGRPPPGRRPPQAARVGSLITARKRSLGQGNIFTPVCHSVHRGGEYLTRYPPRDQVHPPRTRYTPPGPGTPPRTRYTPPGTRYTPPRTRYPPPGTR